QLASSAAIPRIFRWRQWPGLRRISSDRLDGAGCASRAAHGAKADNSRANTRAGDCHTRVEVTYLDVRISISHPFSRDSNGFPIRIWKATAHFVRLLHGHWFWGIRGIDQKVLQWLNARLQRRGGSCLSMVTRIRFRFSSGSWPVAA